MDSPVADLWGVQSTGSMSVKAAHSSRDGLLEILVG